MLKPARLVLLLVVVAAIALLVPWGSTTPLPGDTGERPTAEPAQPAHVAGTRPAVDGAHAEPADAGLERQAAGATAAQATDRHEQRWRIAVVDGTTMQPVPFAELLFVDRRIDYQQLPPAQLRLAQDDEEAFARAFGQRVVADATGRAELVARGFASLNVRKDHLYGELLLNPNDRPKPEPGFPDCVLVRVHPDHTLRVRTVRPGGAACEGVVVALRASGITSTEQLLPPTDAEGNTQLVHTQLYLHTAAGADDEATQVALQLCIAGQDPPPVPLHLPALPIEPVVLTLPATGAVELVLRDAGGAPWSILGRFYTSFELQPVDEQDQERGLELRNLVESLSTDEVPVLRFPQVACGLRFRVADEDGSFAPLVFDGPRADGETVRVDMALQPNVRVLTGRLLDAARMPFQGEASLVYRAESSVGRYPLLHDEQGRFVVLLDDLGAIEDLRIVERDFRRGGPRQAVLERTEPLPPGRTDVGDVVMVASPLLLAGRVTTGPGLELERARLQIQFEWARAEVEPARRRWLPEQEAHVVLDSTGGFEAFQRDEGRLWRVLVTGFCAPFEPIEFTPGTRDLELRVVAPSSVVAEFVHDPLLAGLDVQLWPLQPTDQDDERRRRQRMAHATWQPIGAMARLSWNGLAAGPHRLTVQVPGGPELRAIEFDVPPGGLATDGRLSGIDLRGLARTVTLRLKNGDGSPFDGPVLVVFPTAQALLGDRSGPEVSLLLSAPTDVLLLPYDRKAVRLPALFDDATVPLAAAVPFAVAWPGQSALPDQVAARLQWTCVEGAGLDGPFTEFGAVAGMEASATVRFGSGLPSDLWDGRADGFCTVAVPMRATLVLTRMRDAAEGPVEFLVPTATVVDPATLQADAELPLLPDAAALAAALR